MPQYGYNEISKVAFFGLAFGEACFDAYHQKTLMACAASFFKCVDEVVALVSLDRALLAAEWADFDDVEKAALIQECITEFDIENEIAEEQIERAFVAGLKLVEGLHGAIEAWKGVS